MSDSNDILEFLVECLLNNRVVASKEPTKKNIYYNYNSKNVIKSNIKFNVLKKYKNNNLDKLYNEFIFELK